MVANDTNINQTVEPSWKLWKHQRYILTFLVFLGYFNLYSLSTNMSVAIVTMTKDRFNTFKNGTKINVDPEFMWDSEVQGYVLSSFFYGYLVTQILGGVLSKRYGGKCIFGYAIGGTALLSLVSPWLAELSPFCLIAGRILMGIFEGMTYASIYTIWAKWIPSSERGRLTSQATSGSYSGTVFAMIFYAYLAEIAGWRTIFWFSGSLGVLWCFAWYYFIAEFPDKHSRISTLELQYIQQHVKESELIETISVQWKSILTSTATWALSLALFCEMWGFYTLMMLLPKFFEDIYQLDVSESGDLSTLPYAAVAIMTQITGHIADWVIRKKWLTVTQARKTFMAVGFLSQTGFMMGAAHCSVVNGTVFCLVMALGMGAFVLSPTRVNGLDIAPLNSSVLSGFANTIGAISGVISPIISGYIVSTENPTIEQWRIIFYIAAGLYLFGAIFYTIFGSGLRQPWDRKCNGIPSENTVPAKKDCETTNASFR